MWWHGTSNLWSIVSFFSRGRGVHANNLTIKEECVKYARYLGLKVCTYEEATS